MADRYQTSAQKSNRKFQLMGAKQLAVEMPAAAGGGVGRVAAAGRATLVATCKLAPQL